VSAFDYCSNDIVKLLKREADLVEVVTSPSSQYYQVFNPVEDEQARSIHPELVESSTVVGRLFS